MQKKTKITLIIAIIILLALPVSAYGYSYNNYKTNLNKGISQFDQEDYDESISTFISLSNTYFGKKNDQELNKNIEKAKTLKQNQKTYDDSLELFNQKKFIEAIEGFKKIPSDDRIRYELAKKKIGESIASYVAININNAKVEASDGKFETAITYLELVLALVTDNKDAASLKDEYTKAILAEKEKKEADEKAQKAALQAKPKGYKPDSSILNVPPRKFEQATPAPYTPNHVQGTAAIKQEFQKMGFVFNSDTTALYSKNGIEIGLVNRGQFWQLAIKTWGNAEQGLFNNGMSIILGRDAAWSNLYLIDNALDYPDSVFKTDKVQAFVSNDSLIVHVFVQ